MPQDVTSRAMPRRRKARAWHPMARRIGKSSLAIVSAVRAHAARTLIKCVFGSIRERIRAAEWQEKGFRQAGAKLLKTDGGDQFAVGTGAAPGIIVLAAVERVAGIAGGITFG